MKIKISVILTIIVLYGGIANALTYETAICKRVVYTRDGVTNPGYGKEITVYSNGTFSNATSATGDGYFPGNVVTQYYNGTAWVIQSQLYANLCAIHVPSGKTLVTSIYNYPASCPATCPPNTTRLPDGQCSEPQCNSPFALNLNNECVYCPSGSFALGQPGGVCVPMCNHGTNETVAGIIPAPQGGFCVVPPCTEHETLVGGKCQNNCATLGIGLVYSSDDGKCHPDCQYDQVISEDGLGCDNRCPEGEVWWAMIEGQTPSCQPKAVPVPDCPVINGISAERNALGKCVYTPLSPLDCADGFDPVGLDCVQRPIDCGEGRHQEGDKCVANPPPAEKKTEPPPDSATPPVDPSATPTIAPETPAADKSAEYLKNIDQNIQKQIQSSNADKIILKNIAENQAKQVDNSAKGVEEAQKQTQVQREEKEIMKDVASTLGGIKSEITNQTDQPVKAAIDAMGEKISDKLDEQKTDNTGPDAATFDGGFDTEQDFDEYGNANEMAVDKATAAKESLPAAGASPFIVGTTITQDACIVGNFRGTEWRACFDYPWAVVAYQIMKAVLITVGYIQSIMLINRGMNGG